MRGELGGKAKFVNDPVHGFITVPGGLVLRLLQTPAVQRLRRVRQLGLTELVYPGAVHTRFHHSLGAMHLMRESVASLRSKGVAIENEEEEAALCAMLLHDVGHTPLSHVLEGQLGGLPSHETLSLQIMRKLNRELNGALTQAIDIFTGQLSKTFLHQLVSGQLDVDRLDYLPRDSFFTGVREGSVAVDRLIKMLVVEDEELAVEAKGIYTVEQFLMARRLMYWQVYLHKTVVVADSMLRGLFTRARLLASHGVALPASPSLSYLLTLPSSAPDAEASPEALSALLSLDDSDILQALKGWQKNDDPIVACLSIALLTRSFPRLHYRSTAVDQQEIDAYREQYARQRPELAPAVLAHIIFAGVAQNQAYNPTGAQVRLITPNGHAHDLPEVSRVLGANRLQQPDRRYYLCLPKDFRLP